MDGNFTDGSTRPHLWRVPKILLFIILIGAVCGLIGTRPASAALEPGIILTRLVKLIGLDDSGLPLGLVSRVAYDPVYRETYVYASNNRITIYDKDFFPLGSIGAGRGIRSVSGMAFDRKGRLYVVHAAAGGADSSKAAIITIYDQALFVEREIFISDTPELENFHPLDLAVAADGTIYVVGNTMDDDTVRYQGAAVLDGQGNFRRWIAPTADVLRKTGTAADPDASSVIEAPTALEKVKIDEVGRLYLLSAESGEIYVYDRDENYLFTCGTKGGAKGKLSTPRSLAVDYPRRLIYVVDYMRHTILAHDYDSGAFVYEFGGKGVGPLWYLHPTDIAVNHEGWLVVADLFNRRFQVVDPRNPARPVVAPGRPEFLGAGEPEAPSAPPAGEPAAVVRELPGQPVNDSGFRLAAAAGKPGGLPPLPPRQLRPAAVKKMVAVMPGPAAAGRIAAMPMPARVAAPAAPVLAAAAEEAGVPSRGGVRGNALRAVVGVYGPVAALLEVGGWLLQRHGAE